MNGTNGHPNRLRMRAILALVDCLLIVGGVFLGAVLRFGEDYHYIAVSEYSAWKMTAIVLVIQIGFYYFDLYELIYLRERKKIAVSLLKSLAISFLLLAILYYSIPLLVIGRGILALSLIMIFPLVFFWRLVFAGICGKMLKERILIVGTGELSRKIVGDIYENGRDGFEIIGLVEE
jgi:FlaA1/EpsC-like NDP-sugar epimerase